MSFKVVIPARHASSRLPGKPLADIAGKPMVVRVAEGAVRSGATEVLVATDHEEVRDAVQRHGFAAVMTRIGHASGTDRIAEVATQRGWADDIIVVNVQGDEPCIRPELIDQVAQALASDAEAAMATACYPIASADEFFNPNIVKVVRDARGHALYFSRAPIPWPRNALAGGIDIRQGITAAGRLPDDFSAFRHIGIYAYRVAFLHRYGALGAASLEQVEALEQLRVLWHGFRIHVAETDHAAEAGVDTPEDLERIRCKFDVRKN